MQADTVNGHAAVLRALDDHTHVTERLQGGQRIFTFEEAFDFGGAFGQEPSMIERWEIDLSGTRIRPDRRPPGWARKIRSLAFIAST
jgi:hypothetical protein